MMTIPVLPESAPFRAEQRAWLNGFIAGVLSFDPGATRPPDSGPVAAPAPDAPAAPDTPEEYPWHDPVLSLDERLALAEGKPFALRLMAAMAQLDCGTCGYDCRNYAQAIADGAEACLTKCTPGGKETSRTLKELVASRAA